METRKKLIPYSVYLPPEYYAKIKEAAKDRKASGIVRDAILLMLDGGDAFKSGYNKGIKDAAQVVYECKEAQIVAIKGRDMGAVLNDQILLLKMN